MYVYEYRETDHSASDYDFELYDFNCTAIFMVISVQYSFNEFDIVFMLFV